MANPSVTIVPHSHAEALVLIKVVIVLYKYTEDSGSNQKSLPDLPISLIVVTIHKFTYFSFIPENLSPTIH